MFYPLLIPIFLAFSQVHSASISPMKQNITDALGFETTLSEEDFKAASYVSRLYQNNSEVRPNLVDDIVLPSPLPGQISPITAINNIFNRWTNGEIPYTIDSRYSQKQRAQIAAAFETYHKYTKIRFIPKELRHFYYIHIFPGSGCWSHVGRQFGRQELSLAPGCFYGTAILHELMHAAGFTHEQNRYDRDNFVQIKWENIDFLRTHNFFKVYPPFFVDIAGEYDYDSIMHYDSYAFSWNGKPTIVPLKPGSNDMGYSYKFSKGDIEKLNAMYK